MTDVYPRQASCGFGKAEMGSPDQNRFGLESLTRKPEGDGRGAGGRLGEAGGRLERGWREEGGMIEGDSKEAGGKLEGGWGEVGGRRLQEGWRENGEKVEGSKGEAGERTEGGRKDVGGRLEGSWRKARRRQGGRWRLA